MPILLLHGKPGVKHLPYEVEERHDAVVCSGEHAATLRIASYLSHALRVALLRRVELAEIADGVEGGSDLGHPEVLELRSSGLRLGYPVLRKGCRYGARHLIAGVGGSACEPVDEQTVVLSAALGYEQSVATNRFRGVHNLVFRT